MNFVEGIENLRNPNSYVDLLIDLNSRNESEAFIACLKDSLSIDSEMVFFGIEETEGKLEFEKNGNRYIELFPLETLQEMVEEYVNTYKGLSYYEIAQRLIDYRINDA